MYMKHVEQCLVRSIHQKTVTVSYAYYLYYYITAVLTTKLAIN